LKTMPLRNVDSTCEHGIYKVLQLHPILHFIVPSSFLAMDGRLQFPFGAREPGGMENGVDSGGYWQESISGGVYLWLRDVALSFCPSSVRNTYRPQSWTRVVRAATMTGLIQASLSGLLVLFGYWDLLAKRAAQYGNPLATANETTQLIFSLLFLVEYVLFHFSGIVFSYMAVEGAIRFVGGLCVSEVVPSLPVVLAFKIRAYVRHKRTQHELAPARMVPDMLEVLDDGGDRLRIASALPKERWNASLTIGIQGEWYEVEQATQGTAPRPYVYILRRASVNRILRAYEELDVAAMIGSSSGA